MSEVIPLESALTEIAKLENEIRKGGVIVLPIEGSYVYVADAFNSNAVKKISFESSSSAIVFVLYVLDINMNVFHFQNLYENKSKYYWDIQAYGMH